MSAADRIRVRFVRPYRVYRTGDEIDMDRGPAKGWIVSGIVEPVLQEQRLIEEAMIEHRSETADMPHRRRRK